MTTGIEKRIIPLKRSIGKLSMLIYGKSGTGKTSLASTFPKPMLLLDISEEGTDSISEADAAGISLLQLKTWDEFEEIYFYLQSNPKKYKTVVIDTVTQLQNLAIEQAIKLDGKSPGTLPTKHIWGQATGLLKNWIIGYRDLEMNVVFIAQDRSTNEDVSDEEDQIIHGVGPWVSPSVAAILNAAVKIIGHTHIYEVSERVKEKRGTKVKRRVEYRLRLGPHSYYLTKMRVPKEFEVPSFISNPNYSQITLVMEGKVEKVIEKPKVKKGESSGKIKIIKKQARN